MKKLFGILFALIIALPALSSPAITHACSCLASTPEALFEAADAVFYGEVKDWITNGEIRRAGIKVEKVWKGSVAEDIVVTTPINSAACGVDLPRGERLVFAVGEKDNGVYEVSLCGYTDPDTAQAEDYFGEGWAPLPAPVTENPSILYVAIGAIIGLAFGMVIGHQLKKK